MRVLIQDTPKKEDFVSMATVRDNRQVFVGGNYSTTYGTPKNLDYSDAMRYRCGGNAFAVRTPNTTARKTMLEINSKCILSYVNMPFFPVKTTDADGMILYITVDGVEHTFTTYNDNSSLGRLFAFNAPNNWDFFQHQLQSPSNLYAQGLGLVCDFSLKVELEFFGYASLDPWANMSFDQHYLHVAYRAIGLNDEIPFGIVDLSGVAGSAQIPQHVTPLKRFA